MEALGFSLPLWAWATVFTIGVGGLLVVYGVIPLVKQLGGVKVATSFPTLSPDGARVLLLAVIVVSLFGGAVYGLTLIDYIRPKKVWIHPGDGDQTKALGDCEMRAYEAIGGQPLGDVARTNYIQSCMKSKGFELKEVDDN